jgi:hypothetical protein
MLNHQLEVVRSYFKSVWNKESILRGLIVTASGLVFMLCCLTILTLSSCTFTP